MQTLKHNHLKRNFLILALGLIAPLFLQSCAKKYAFAISSIVPAAEGSVIVKKDKNKNYNIQLKVANLADPKRLSPPRDMYIVWMETDHSSSTNIGQLKTSSGMMSKALKSSLSTVTSFKPTAFFITAENHADIQYPDGEVVLKTGQISVKN
ncbi:MAG: hypothetical protein IPP15_23855 [Saprospiraceae bacterium]|uniref:Uncharacterized protein n=1 Tax=Candidatus Opimibacter skivensis TaxID=2982028 RepID=A0A9D7SZS3_9BACT|nr:hypothetical protein [Candidatus Opimibacter skivensis]